MDSSLSASALRILEARYLAKNGRGRVVETVEEMFLRVARHVAAAERTFHPDASAASWENRFFSLLSSLDFLPNSPTLMNAGRALGQLSACFVLPVEDSLASIFDAVRNTALIHQSGGGTGFSFGRLRPKNDRVSTTGGEASGPVSFMEIFNQATDVVRQGGTRRGANMAVLPVDHPDIEEFVTAKRIPGRFANFNLSVGMPDSFLREVRENGFYDLVNPRTGRPAGRVKAAGLFDLITDCAWEGGEPGLLFLDEINRHNPTPDQGALEATNPCGEQPLLPYESCNLGSVNLVRMVRRDGKGVAVDWKKLEDTVFCAVRFLDDVIEVNRYPLTEIDSATRGNRKIGLGVMGFAHLLIRLGIPYHSPEAIGTAESVMAFIQEKGREASRELARERGAFPRFKGSLQDRRGAPPVRNATVTTLAPTGTLSLIAGCSPGIEPLFGLSSSRIAAGNIEISETDPLFLGTMREKGLLTPERMRFVERNGRLPDDQEIPAGLRRLFETACGIPPEFHVRIQAAFQKFTDNAVSKTVNFPASAGREAVRDAFLLAHELRCKGITVYRDGSRAGQVLRCGLHRLC